MRVDEASHEKKRRETFLLLVYSFLLLFFVLFVTLFFFFLLVLFLLFSSVLFDYDFLFKPTAILEKSYTLTQTLPFFFTLYVGQPVRTTAAPGRLF